MAQTETVTITYSDRSTKALYEAVVEGHEERAELTVSKLSEKTVIVDHTAVPDALRGMGLARALAERVIADARAKGQTIVPLCPFFRAHATKHREELADVIQW